MNKKELMEKTKCFFKEYGAMIATGVTAVVSITGLTVFGVKLYKKAKSMEKIMEIVTRGGEDHNNKIKDFNPNWSVGSIHDIWDHSNDEFIATEVIVDNLKFEDLGKLGEELLKSKDVIRDSDIQTFVIMTSKNVKQ